DLASRVGRLDGTTKPHQNNSRAGATPRDGTIDLIERCGFTSIAVFARRQPLLGRIARPAAPTRPWLRFVEVVVVNPIDVDSRAPHDSDRRTGSQAWGWSAARVLRKTS